MIPLHINSVHDCVCLLVINSNCCTQYAMMLFNRHWLVHVDVFFSHSIKFGLENKHIDSLAIATLVDDNLCCAHAQVVVG